MALEKPTRGKPVRERVFLFFRRSLSFTGYSNTQKIWNQLISTRKINFCLDLRAEQQKSSSDFFCFLPRFLCCCTDCTDLKIRAQSFFSRKPCPEICLENRACCLENRTVRTVQTSNKCWCLHIDLCALFAAILSLYLCAAKFFPLLRKNGNFLSSLSQLSLLTSICKSEAKFPSNAFLRKP